MSKKPKLKEYNDPNNPYREYRNYSIAYYVDPKKKDKYKKHPWARIEKPLQMVLAMNVMTQTERQLFWIIYLETRGWKEPGPIEAKTKEGLSIDEISKQDLKLLTGLNDRSFDRALNGLWKKHIVYCYNDDGPIEPQILLDENGDFVEYRSLCLYKRKEKGIKIAINFGVDTWIVSDKAKQVMEYYFEEKFKFTRNFG